MPIRLGVVFVAVVLPGGDFLDQSVFVGDTSIEALARENAEFRLCHIQPTAVPGRVVPLEPLDEAACFGGGEGLVQRSRLVGAEVVLPELQLDNREIIAARLVLPEELRGMPPTGPVVAYLGGPPPPDCDPIRL